MIKFNNLKPDKGKSQKYYSAIKRVINSGWYILGSQVADFESKFARYLNRKYCIGVANGLEALQISLMTGDIGPGDEVITTPLSAAATALAIMAVGATPVFVDTTNFGQIDPKLVPSAITNRTKAVIPVHLYGTPSRVDQLKAICHKKNILLIEDACQAHGSTLHGQKLGTFGDLGCFSFYPTKNLGALGDGGAIVTNSKKLADQCRMIRDYGQKKKYLHQIYGLNSRLDEIQAAILNEKLKSLDQENLARRSLAQRYTDNLKPVSQVKLLSRNYILESNHHLFVIATPRRNKLKEFLAAHSVETHIHYPNIIPQQPFLKNKLTGITKFPVSENLTQEILSLPCYPTLGFKKVDFISNLIYDLHHDV